MDLYHAAEAGDLERVEDLVKQGVDKEKKSEVDGFTPLDIASCHGFVNVVRHMVEHGAEVENVNGYFSWTALMTASCFDRIDVVRYLLEQGADRDKADVNVRTSLHLEDGCLETAKLLMVYGADLNARDNDSQLPIDVARTEEIKQAIRDEPRRRMDEAPGKRATDQDRHPNAATSASAQQDNDGNEEDEEPSNKKSRLNEKAVTEEGKVAEEDENSEPSDEEDDDWILNSCSNLVARRVSIVVGNSKDSLCMDVNSEWNIVTWFSFTKQTKRKTVNHWPNGN